MTGKTAFETRYGFRRNEVLLSNWRESPLNRSIRLGLADDAHLLPVVIELLAAIQTHYIVAPRRHRVPTRT